MPALSDFSRPTQHLTAADPRETLVHMRQMARLGINDARVRLLAEQIVRNVFPHDYLSEFAAFLNWVRTHIRYSRDPVDIEQLKTPQVTLETETGDCDDQSILLAAFCAQLGARVRFVAGAFKFSGSEPIFAHVWCEAFDPSSKVWVVLDAVPGRRVAEMIDRLVDSMVLMVAE